MSENLIALLASPVILLVVREVYKDVRAWIKVKRDKKPFKKAFLDISQIYQEMNNLMVSVNAGRVLLLRSHNGGGKPTIGKPLYSTAEYEVYQSGTISVKDNWKGEPLDESYIRMLSRLQEQNELILKLGKIEDGLPKRVYFHGHVLASKIYKIHEDEKSFYYLSINFNMPKDIEDPNFSEVCRPFITRIKALFNDKG